ncbi:MAG: metallophosphoesterase [Ignavibacteria bacterium]|nr:metallophosphoesterase [Ignavibacteria bacterium]
MIMFFVVFFSLYTIVNSYIFIRGWQSLALFPQARIFYAIIFIIAASSYIIGRAFSDSLPNYLYVILIWIGSFWFFFLFYFFLSIVLIDLIRLFDKFLHFLPKALYENPEKIKFYVGLTVLVVTTFFAIYGYINRTNIKIKELDIELNNNPKKEYVIVFFSDLHISVVNNHSFLKKVVDKINSLAPDLILIGGDLVDEKAKQLREKNLANDLKNLNSKYGIYSITGNHEYINNADSTVKFLEALGIKFLRDEVVLVDSSFYIIGREDFSKFNFTKKRRKTLEELTRTLDKSYPKILLDHQPLNLIDAVDNKIDLQLSGHTHHGQIAPANLITKLVYEVSWGYKKKENTHVYVTSGIGTWGPPIKIGNDAELILIKLKF